MADFKPKAYVKEGCPYSRKYLQFMGDSGLLDKIEVIQVSAMDPEYEDTRAMLTEQLGKRVTFPTVEVEPGQFKSDSNELIRYFADRYGGEESERRH